MNTHKFRLLKVSVETPAHLLFFKEIDGVKVYQSAINTAVYILHDSVIGMYYSLQYLKVTFDTLDLDLHKNIERYIKSMEV
jgi:hypothetical protein